MSSSPCPICLKKNNLFLFQSSDYHGRYLLSQLKFSLYKCQECQTIFLPKNFSKKDYPNDYYSTTLPTLSIFLANILNNLSLYLKQKIISKYLSKKISIKILDIGSGNCEFLDSLDKSKFIKFGLDINPQAISIGHKKNIKMFSKDIRNLNISTKFDVITMFHVLEHTNNPNSLIKKIYQTLNQNGILIVSVPNTNSFGYKFGKQFWFHLDSPRHLFIPNTDSLTKFFLNHSFKKLSVKSEFYDYPLDLFWSIRFSLLRFLIYPIYPIIKLFDQETLTFILKKA